MTSCRHHPNRDPYQCVSSRCNRTGQCSEASSEELLAFAEKMREEGTLLKIWREECERAPARFIQPTKSLCFDEDALTRIGEAIEAVAGVPAEQQAARSEDAAAGDQLPMAPVCAPCASNEDGRCCGTGECWLCPLSAETARNKTFQHRVEPWMLTCFGAEVSRDRTERSHRFLEEALELVQAAGCTAGEAHQLVDYVFGRATGKLSQEVGGVMVTLAALCLAQGVDMHAAGDTELARVWTKIDVIRAKHAAKPKHSPLPGAGDRAREHLPDAFWEALQRLIENAAVQGPASREDAKLVGRYRDFLALLAAPAVAAAPFVHDATERDVIVKRMRRVARIAGVENAMPGDDVLYACIGTMLGTIASALQRAAALGPLPLMHQAFRTTETEGDPDPTNRRYSMIFDFPSLAALQAAEAEWVSTVGARIVQQVADPFEPIRLLAPQPAPARDVVPGKVHCAKCGFTLQRVNLYMLNGTTGAGGEETEPCPNDGTPLLPVTWEQEAREAMNMAEQQFDRAHALEAAGAELVDCKDLKDEESRRRQRRDVAISRDPEATARVDAMRDDYNRRKPLAWAALRALLSKGGAHG